MNKKSSPRILFSFLILLCTTIAFAQVGIGTTSPDPSAALDIKSTDSGMLTPRMTTAQRTSILNPAQGLFVFDTDVNSFYVYHSGVWNRLVSDNTLSDYTGWADYVDGTYTSSNPLSLTTGVKVTLPNDAATIRDSQIPNDVTEFYNASSQTITGRDGDALNIVIEFKARPTSITATTRLTVTIDIGGAVGEIYRNDFLLGKGNGVEHYYLSSFGAYTLNTWEANGGTVKIVVSNGPAEVYDIRYVITRTHKAR
ncbi:MAG: hypothetical protein R3359_10115 [Marinirhabdus sp.]|nr:hypothetical protein [Marinirhabdus sp.]